MRKRYFYGALLAGFSAGMVNGIFGGAGGMLLIPILQKLTDLKENALFPTSVRIMLPVCAFALWLTARTAPLPWETAMPYLLGSVAGGILAGLAQPHIPLRWLHRVFGILILWGGIRYLW